MLLQSNVVVRLSVVQTSWLAYLGACITSAEAATSRAIVAFQAFRNATSGCWLPSPTPSHFLAYPLGHRSVNVCESGVCRL